MQEDEILKPIDARGKNIHVGSRVRIVKVPIFTWVEDLEAREERERVFGHLLGKCKTVIAFDKNGFVELGFKIRQGIDAGYHFVWLEPEFLLVQKLNS